MEANEEKALRQKRLRVRMFTILIILSVFMALYLAFEVVTAFGIIKL